MLWSYKKKSGQPQKDHAIDAKHGKKSYNLQETGGFQTRILCRCNITASDKGSLKDGFNTFNLIRARGRPTSSFSTIFNSTTCGRPLWQPHRVRCPVLPPGLPLHLPGSHCHRLCRLLLAAGRVQVGQQQGNPVFDMRSSFVHTFYCRYWSHQASRDNSTLCYLLPDIDIINRESETNVNSGKKPCSKKGEI